MLTSAVPPCRSCKNTPPPPPAPLPESSPVASRCLGVGPPELRRVITACSPCAHHAVTPSGAGWLLLFIPGRPMCSFLLILSLGSPLPSWSHNRFPTDDISTSFLPPWSWCVFAMKEGEEPEAYLSRGPQLHSGGIKLFRSPEKKPPSPPADALA